MILSFETPEVSYEIYLATLPQGGEYAWTVTALDGGGITLREAKSLAFQKPEYQLLPTLKQYQPPEKEPGGDEPGGDGGGDYIDIGSDRTTASASLSSRS